MTITVYSKPGCQQYKFTCLALDNAGIRYCVVDLTTNAAALEYVQDLGYSQAPIVVVNEHHYWSGFNSTEIERLKPFKQRSVTHRQPDAAHQTKQDPPNEKPTSSRPLTRPSPRHATPNNR